MTLDPIPIAALCVVLLLLTLLAVQKRRRGAARRRPARVETVDTVTDFRPEATHVLTVHELWAMRMLVEAMPGFLVLSQVPLARFLRVMNRSAYADWLARVGNLNADLLLCDANSRVLAVIDVRAPQESERSQKRHERMMRVLRAASVPVLVWRQDALPAAAEVRAQVDALLTPHRSRAAIARGNRASAASDVSPMPLPEVTELLAEGDARAEAAEWAEPVASGFFDEFQTDAAVGAP